MSTNRREFIQQLSGLALGAAGLSAFGTSAIAGTPAAKPFLKYHWRNGHCIKRFLQKNWTTSIFRQKPARISIFL